MRTTDWEAESNYCVPASSALYIKWGVSGFGYGELYFYEKDEQIYCDNELLSKDTIKKILNIMVDNCELTCT